MDNYKSKYLKYKKKYLNLRSNFLSTGTSSTNITNTTDAEYSLRSSSREINITNEINHDIWMFLDKINKSVNNYWLQFRIDSYSKSKNPKDKRAKITNEIYKDKKYQLVTNNQIIKLVENANQIYSQLEIPNKNYLIKMIIKKNSKIAFFGDYHSALHSLAECLLDLKNQNFFLEEKSWVLKEDEYIIFTGDIVDRGPYGIECLYLLYQLFILNNYNGKNKVIILNGNHEEKETYKVYGFLEEVKKQINLNNFESNIPLYQDNVPKDQNNLPINQDKKDEGETDTEEWENEDINIDVSSAVNNSVLQSLEEKILEGKATYEERTKHGELRKKEQENRAKEEKKKSREEQAKKRKEEKARRHKSYEIGTSFEDLIKKLPLALFLKYEDDDYWYQFCHGAVDESVQLNQFETFNTFLESNVNYMIIDIEKKKDGNGFLWNDLTNYNISLIDEIQSKNLNTSQALDNFVKQYIEYKKEKSISINATEDFNDFTEQYNESLKTNRSINLNDKFNNLLEKYESSELTFRPINSNVTTTFNNLVKQYNESLKNGRTINLNLNPIEAFNNYLVKKYNESLEIKINSGRKHDTIKLGKTQIFNDLVNKYNGLLKTGKINLAEQAIYYFIQMYNQSLYIGRPIIFKNVLKNIFDKNKIKFLISGHQDLINLGLVIKDEFMNYEKYVNTLEYSNEIYLKTIGGLNPTLREINEMDSRTVSLDLDINELYAITLSSAVISKSLPFSIYGILDSNERMKMNYFKSCSTYSFMKGQNNSSAIPSCDSELNIKGYNLINNYKSINQLWLNDLTNL